MNLPITGTVTSQVRISEVPMNLNVIRQSLVPVLNKVQSIEQVNSNIILICLLLEGVEKCSKVLGIGFQTELIEVLYPLLVKVMSTFTNVGDGLP